MRRYSNRRFDGHTIIAISYLILMVGFWAGVVTGWATHIIWSISTLASNDGATIGQGILAAIGAFMPPVGVIHGVMIWFGAGMP